MEKKLLKSNFKLKSFSALLLKKKKNSLYAKQFTWAHSKMDIMPTSIMNVKQNMPRQNQPANWNSQILKYGKDTSSNFVSVVYWEKVWLICHLFIFIFIYRNKNLMVNAIHFSELKYFSLCGSSLYPVAEENTQYRCPPSTRFSLARSLVGTYNSSWIRTVWLIYIFSDASDISSAGA